jgi:hypothetical protein
MRERQEPAGLSCDRQGQAFIDDPKIVRNIPNHVAHLTIPFELVIDVMELRKRGKRAAFWNPQPRLGQGRPTRGAAPKAPFREAPSQRSICAQPQAHTCVFLALSLAIRASRCGCAACLRGPGGAGLSDPSPVDTERWEGIRAA